MKLESLFEQTHQLPQVPKLVQELIESFNNDDVNVDEIAEKLAMDQVITAKVLRLANSARYGMPRQVASVDDAVVLLGFNALRTLVVASGVAGAFPEIPGFDRNRFWKHSFLTAGIAKHLAKGKGVNPEMAFTAGMLHNIGELLMHVLMPEEMAKIDKAIQAGGQRADTQLNHLGYNYADVGAGLAAFWKFPEEMQQAIRLQYTSLSDEPGQLALTNNLSAYIADVILDDEELSPSEEQSAIANALGINLATILDDLDKVKEQAEAFDALLD